MEKKKFLTLDEENCQGIKLHIAHKIKRLNSRLVIFAVHRFQ